VSNGINRWLAAASAGFGLAALGTGALLADHRPGLDMAHRVLAVAAILLALPLLRERLVQALLIPGIALAALPLPAVLHALAAPLVLAPALVLAVPVGHMAAEISPVLRRIIAAGPPLVLLQIALGAAYRNKHAGVIWHLIGAMSVAGLLVVACVLLLRQVGTERAPRMAAAWVNGLLLVQVTLGMATLMLRMLDMEAAHVAAAHIAGGSLTFAGTLVLWRSTRTNGA
jgi:heme A synthase